MGAVIFHAPESKPFEKLRPSLQKKKQKTL